MTILLQRARQQGPDEVGPDEVREIYGIDPSQVPDFIALRGDPSDGLPGAKGIGAKTAADILQRKGDLEHAILGAIREKPSVRRALIEQADELRMFKGHRDAALRAAGAASGRRRRTTRAAPTRPRSSAWAGSRSASETPPDNVRPSSKHVSFPSRWRRGSARSSRS